MPEFLNRITISNFKSIRSCELTNCKRINLFIGRPNAGRSNIIEALSLFSIPYLRENSSKKLSNFIRLENETELFYNGHTTDDITIKADDSACTLQYSAKEGMVASLYFHTDPQKESIKGNFYNNIRINDKLVVSGIKNNIHFVPPIKQYLYKPDIKYKKSHARYLVPPFGFNLLSIIEEYPDLKKEITGLFDQYRLSIAFDKASQTIKVIQDKSNNNLFLIPYNSIADTLQRIIFYKTAIASNNNSILLFEEPEAHSFPPYMTYITQEMIHNTDNQYFITTHSPFILNDLLENAKEELAVFMVHYENFETRARQLTNDELNKVYQNGVDLFTNYESFV
ncbi:MAG: hypothetical protein EPN37_00705 [Chitinophagaceae bacterium]|nr:MAG: hypothetical protein EPN37_00705 [Chitinophagaceae bacterium]